MSPVISLDAYRARHDPGPPPPSPPPPRCVHRGRPPWWMAVWLSSLTVLLAVATGYVLVVMTILGRG